MRPATLALDRAPAPSRGRGHRHVATVATDFAGRVLSLDQAAAQAYAEIAATRRRTGRPIMPFDGQIAAIARSRYAGVATRNLADFESCGIEVIDPWRR